ncbi:MAG: hypothetical protein JO028_16905, partial [Acidobacteriaceae bacterium]|nr:hypothetical protein [Acidobacteriaceae bacterium]
LTGTALVCAAVAPFAFAGQNGNTPGMPVSMVVTLEGKHHKEIPPIAPQDITVSQGRDKRPVTGLTPAGQNGKGMQLLLLIDDSARFSFGTEINTLRQFVNALPATTEVAIGYMRNGTNQMVSNFTTNHAAAANSIRLALGTGGADVSPYDSLSDAVRHWPESGAERKIIIMISSGIEGLGGGYTSDNPYVNRGIEDAQKAGVVVYTIYNPSAGHYGHSFWRANWGQNFLSQLSDETGGESYMVGFGSPVSFQPFLQQITGQLQHQYILTFEAKPENKSGLQPVKVSIIEKDASIAAADKVYVKAGM